MAGPRGTKQGKNLGKNVKGADGNGQLSRERIIESALRVVKRDGFDGLTMRSLADELGVTAMAPYYYVANKEQLLEWVADAILAEQSPVPEDLSWDEAIRFHALDFFDRVTAYPGLAAFLTNRPLTPGVRRTYGGALELYRRAGLDDDEAMKAHAMYHTLMFGVVAMEARFRPEKRRRGRDEDAILVHVSPHEFVTYCVEVFVAGVRDRAAAAGR
jgi:AcrR family transcriptional regulator